MHIVRGETAEYINIYALSKGDQILLCKSTKEENNKEVFLWSNRNNRYQLSAAGIEYKRRLPKFNTFEHRYIAEVEYYWVNGNNKEFWKALADMNEFKLWDIENGPLEYYRYKPIDTHRLAIYFVSEINEIIKREDIVQYNGRFPPYNDKMLTSVGMDKVENAKKESIWKNREFEFFKRKDKILRTMNDFLELNMNFESRVKSELQLIVDFAARCLYYSNELFNAYVNRVSAFICVHLRLIKSNLNFQQPSGVFHEPSITAKDAKIAKLSSNILCVLCALCGEIVTTGHRTLTLMKFLDNLKRIKNHKI